MDDSTYDPDFDEESISGVIADKESAHFILKDLKRNSRRSHILPCNKRSRIFCQRQWTKERFCWSATVTVAFIVTSIMAMILFYYWERELKHGLTLGFCEKSNCTFIPNPRQEVNLFEIRSRLFQYHVSRRRSSFAPAQIEGDSTCCCNYTFQALPYSNPDNGNDSPTHSHLLCNLNSADCFHHNTSTKDSCWSDPDSRIWKEPPSLWIIRQWTLIVIFAATALSLFFIFCCTQSAIPGLLPFKDGWEATMEQNYRNAGFHKNY